LHVLKLKHLEIWLWKQQGKTVIKTTAHETLEEFQRYRKFSSKRFLGRLTTALPPT